MASADQLLRVLEIATIDTLGLDNSVARSRTLISAVLAGAKLLEIGELQTRIQLLEAAVWLRPDQAAGGLGGGLLGEA